MKRNFSPGDWVIYRKSKRSTMPGPRAQAVKASTKGEKYSYVVDKFWVVENVMQDGEVLLRTRRGKLHRIPASDLNLRHANMLERLIYRSRFRDVSSNQPVPSSARIA